MTSTRGLQPLTLSLTYNFDFTDCPLGLDYFICQISQAEPNDKPVYVYVRGTFDSDTKFLEFFGQFQLIAFGHKPIVLKALFYEQLALQTNPYLPSSSPEYNIQQNMWGDIRFGLASTRIRDKYLNTKNLLALKLSQRSQNIIVEISYKFDVTIGHPDPRAFPSLLENHATYLARICKELTPKTFGSPRHFWLDINDSLSFADAKLITHLDVDFMRMDLVDFSINSPVFSTLYTSRIRINQLNILAHIDPSLPISFAPLRLAHQLQIDIHDHPMNIITGSGIHVKVCSIALTTYNRLNQVSTISTTIELRQHNQNPTTQIPELRYIIHLAFRSDVSVSPWCSAIIHAVKCPCRCGALHSSMLWFPCRCGALHSSMLWFPCRCVLFTPPCCGFRVAVCSSLLHAVVSVSLWCSSLLHAVVSVSLAFFELTPFPTFGTLGEHSDPNLIIASSRHSFAVPHSYEWAALISSSLTASLRMAAPQYQHCTAFLRMGSHTYTAPHSYEWAVTWFSRSHNTALICHLDEGPSKLWEGRGSPMQGKSLLNYANDMSLSQNVDMDSQTRGTVRNLRIREDTANYLYNLDEKSAYYDPKSRSMRGNPLEDSSSRDKSIAIFAGENAVLCEGEVGKVNESQLLARHAQSQGIDINALAEPTKLETFKKEYGQLKASEIARRRQKLLEKYGDASSR
ncbi:pre-mRNA splicing prp18-interacting factor domain-containing protein [Ditylenchus destructor]|uniref:Pre-mRNA-splicing factor SLU7 n=1 Tax=Ditylenchus destructor TaxID=166010 RepID=A0AAD4NA18_9BILA|nr:pre-mRNA splicing prp18-interacting factor domain-containing protein [Ditylenchus destructor]